MFPGYLSPLIKFVFASAEDGICTVGVKTGMAYVLLQTFRKGSRSRQTWKHQVGMGRAAKM